MNTESGQSRTSQSWHHTHFGQDNNPLYDLYVLSIWRIFDSIAGLYPVYASLRKKNPQGIIAAVSLVSTFPAVFHVQTNIHMFTFANSLIFPLPNWGSFILSNIFSIKIYLFNLSLYAHPRVSAYFSRNVNTIVRWDSRTHIELISYGWTFRYYQLPQL